MATNIVRETSTLTEIFLNPLQVTFHRFDGTPRPT
jgi:hypothetical protein